MLPGVCVISLYIISLWVNMLDIQNQNFLCWKTMELPSDAFTLIWYFFNREMSIEISTLEIQQLFSSFYLSFTCLLHLFHLSTTLSAGMCVFFTFTSKLVIYYIYIFFLLISFILMASLTPVWVSVLYVNYVFFVFFLYFMAIWLPVWVTVLPESIYFFIKLFIMYIYFI